MRLISRFVLLLIAGMLAACQAAAPAPTAQLSPTLPATPTPASVGTPFPTRTLQPSFTPLPTSTPTSTAVPTSTPDPALASVRLLGVSWQRNYDLLLSIQFPGPVDASQYQVKVEDKWYTCQVLPQEPERLFCIGQGMRVYDRVRVQIFPAGSDTAGFEGSISIPYFTN